MVRFTSTFVLVCAAVLALAAAFPFPNPSLALKLSSRTFEKNGAAPTGSVKDKGVQAFVESYLTALTVCDIDQITDKFAVGYVAFRAQGDAIDAARQRVGIVGFCEGFKGTTFSLVEANQVSPTVVFIRVEATNCEALPGGPVMYSQALSLAPSPSGFKIKSEVTSASSVAFQAATGGGRGDEAEAE